MSLDVNGEIIKLARELGLAAVDLDFLATAERDHVHRLRVALEAALDERNRGIYRRIEASSHLVPLALSTKIAMASFPPLIVARVSEEIPAERALKFLDHVPVDYLADCMMYLNPTRSAETVRQMPAELMEPIIHELVGREEYVTLGRFLGVMSNEQLPGVVRVINDGRALLLIGFHDEDPSNLDDVVQTMSDAQVTSILEAVVEHGLGAEFAAVAAHVSPASEQRLRLAAANLEGGARDRLMALIGEHGVDLTA